MKFPAHICIRQALLKDFGNPIIALKLFFQTYRERERESAQALIMYLDNAASPLTHTSTTKQKNSERVAKQHDLSTACLQRELNGYRGL